MMKSGFGIDFVRSDYLDREKIPVGTRITVIMVSNITDYLNYDIR
jgi:hypothetical protein